MAASQNLEVAMKKDPVCGMQVDEKNAESSQKAGDKQYFCSSECKDKYERNPEQYKKSA